MRLRIIKKKSKQALPIMIKHYGGYRGKLYMSERGESHHSLIVTCKCPKDKMRIPGKRYGFTCECKAHPLPGTPMVGGMEGYYEPEWWESTLLGELRDAVLWNERSKTMNSKEWQRVLRISGITETQRLSHDEWIRAST